MDKVGNEKEITFKVRTLKKDKKNEENKEQDENKTDQKENESSKKDNEETKKKDTKENNKNDKDEENKTDQENKKDEENKEESDLKEIPEISLSEVPDKIKYGEKYKLPSSYKFGSKGGTVSCIVESKEYKDTSTIGIGQKKIECSAKSNTGVEVKVSKEIEVEVNKESEEQWDGWIRMNLYYPEESTDWQWRLGKEDEVRTGTNQDGWIDYVGPITIRLTDVENVYIRYKLPNGEEKIIPPAGKLLVDIEPESYSLKNGEKTKVKINYSDNADKKEYRINKGNWQKYTGIFEVENDTKIEARVIKENNGEKVTNYDSVYIRIKQKENGNNGGSQGGTSGGNTSGGNTSGGSETDKGNEYGKNYEETSDYIVKGPNIEVKPNDISEKKEISITTEQEARKIYYKIGDNGRWQEYKDIFEIDKNNIIIYAKYITKEEGTTSKISTVYINNIKENKKPSVSIDLSTTSLTKEVEVTIKGYDANKIEYSYDGIIYNDYTGSIKVNKNCRIYAKATNEYGTTVGYRNITNIGENPPSKGTLSIGIILNPNEEEITGLINKTEVEINYDKNATKKYYKIGSNDNWKEYTGSFTVKQNTTIYAYATNEDATGYETKSISYLTTGISDPIIKTNTTSATPSVKISINYDEIIKNESSGIEVEDSSGNKTIFKDNYYIVEDSIEDLIGNILMRWDYKTPSKPNINIDTTKPTRKVKVDIDYDKYSKVKEYKIVTKDGKDTGWLNYEDEIEIVENDTIIYARGKSSMGDEGEVSARKITNIDEESPTIDIRGDLETGIRKLTVQLVGKDNLGIDSVGYIKGKKDAEEVLENGIELENNESFDIDENGYYTIYAKDKVGNVTIKVIEITNIDKTAPNITINVLTKKYSSKTEVEIDYGNSTTKEYKIGENGEYKKYTNKLTINAEDVVNLANEDKTITIYARGTNQAGNTQEVSEKIYSIDLDIPKSPIITAEAGYPILTEYGVKLQDVLSIQYDDRDDITNYISMDGKTWNVYTGVEHIKSGTVYAKSVKKESGLNVQSSKKVVQPTDALGLEAYDGNESTYHKLAFKATVYLDVDESMQGKNTILI